MDYRKKTADYGNKMLLS